MQNTFLFIFSIAAKNKHPLYPFKFKTAPAILHISDANSHLLHSKWVSLFVVQIFLQVEEGVKEYVGHPATLQITEGYLTWRKQHIHKHIHTC